MVDYQALKALQAVIEFQSFELASKSLGISQSELAQLCNLSVNGISKFESNAGDREVKLSTLFKLSEVLGFKLSLEFEE